MFPGGGDNTPVDGIKKPFCIEHPAQFDEVDAAEVGKILHNMEFGNISNIAKDITVANTSVKINFIQFEF